ncbi:MAG: hypothetical protein WCP26_11440 [Actinomycetes bacterium]
MLRLVLYGSLALAVGLGVAGEASAAIGPSSTHAYAGMSSSTQATGISSGGWSDSPPYRTNLATFYSFKVTD